MDAVEVELKFQVPATERARLRRALDTTSARRVRLQAVYADTADQRLAAAGFALRLRKEGRRWVQTLKGRGDNLMTRLEHEVPLPPQRGVPVLDPARHAGTPAGDALARLLADGAPLQERYRTDIHRLLRHVRSGGAVVEVAFDEGRIRAGALSLPVCELEMELVSGPASGLLQLAERWVQRHGLWLDVRTKSERGHRLALGVAEVPAVRATAPALRADDAPAQWFAAALLSALAQVLPNLAEVGQRTANPDALHQLRVGLRRLRTALREFAPWSADPAAALALEQDLAAPFGRLGAARDADVLQAWLGPALLAAGGPALPGARPGAAAQAPDGVAQDPALTVLLLRALRLALATPATPAPEAPAEPPPAPRALLRRAWKRLMAEAAAYETAPAEAQHRCRKRLKRLRYSTEFLQTLLPRKPAKRALSAMRDALEALGEHNDLLVAQAQTRYAEPAATDGAGWFAKGWLAGQRPLRLARAVAALQALAALPPFWPGRR